MAKTYTRPGSTKRWIALDVPEGLQAIIGTRRFAQSTGESDLNRAKAVAARLEAGWRQQIQDARDGKLRLQQDHERAALALYDRLRAARTPEERAAIAAEIDTRHGEMLGTDLVGPGAPPPASDQFKGLATGVLVPVLQHLEAYLKSKAGDVERKSLDQARSIVERFAKRFEYVRDVTRRGVQEYVNELAANGSSPQTIRRLKSQLRTYWKYLQAIEVAPDGETPFDGLQRQNSDGKAARARRRQAFTPKEIAGLIVEARHAGHEQLADAITIFAYTGMRLDELASMKTTQVRAGAFHVKEGGDGKTEAATRIVPIHSAIASLVKRLCKASTDGYLLSGLSDKNKYKKRGLSITDAFGRLKRNLGYDKRYVLHSIRHTVTTLLIQAGIDQVVRYEILGHEHEDLEERVYGHGVTMKQKRDAIERLKYPRA